MLYPKIPFSAAPLLHTNVYPYTNATNCATVRRWWWWGCGLAVAPSDVDTCDAHDWRVLTATNLSNIINLFALVCVMARRQPSKPTKPTGPDRTGPSTQFDIVLPFSIGLYAVCRDYVCCLNWKNKKSVLRTPCLVFDPVRSGYGSIFTHTHDERVRTNSQYYDYDYCYYTGENGV